MDDVCFMCCGRFLMNYNDMLASMIHGHVSGIVGIRVRIRKMVSVYGKISIY